MNARIIIRNLLYAIESYNAQIESKQPNPGCRRGWGPCKCCICEAQYAARRYLRKKVRK
jgi:hypothetical protein